MRVCVCVYVGTHLPVFPSERFCERLMKGDGRIRGWMYATLLENPKYAPADSMLNYEKRNWKYV